MSKCLVKPSEWAKAPRLKRKKQPIGYNIELLCKAEKNMLLKALGMYEVVLKREILEAIDKCPPRFQHNARWKQKLRWEMHQSLAMRIFNTRGKARGITQHCDVCEKDKPKRDVEIVDTRNVCKQCRRA